jgi:hypothetical protein
MKTLGFSAYPETPLPSRKTPGRGKTLKNERFQGLPGSVFPARKARFARGVQNLSIFMVL